MKIISNFKRALCVGAASLFAFAALPVALSGNASAVRTCTDGITSWQQLQNAVTQRPRQTNIKLCDDITMNGTLAFSTTMSEYRVTLNLNGHNLTRNIGNAISVQRNAYLTIVGSGKITGGISADTNRLTITGGTYTANPTNYVKDAALYAYHVGNEYRVETKLTDGNVTVTPESIKVRKGGTDTVTVGLPTDSTSDITYTSNDASVATVSDGTIIGVEVGTTKVTATTTHTPAVVKEVEVEVLPVLTSVTASDLVVRVGEEATLAAPTVEDASITGATFSYVSGDEAVATVDADTGVITGVSAGRTTLTVAASYTDALGEMTTSTTVNLTVYDVVAGEGDDDAVASTTLIRLTDGGLPDDPADYSDDLKETLGAEYSMAGPAIKGTMISGGTLTTTINVEEIEPDEVTKVSVENAFKADGINTDGIKYYDVTVEVMDGGDSLGNMHKLNDKVKVVLAEVEDPANGYERTYYVVKYHNGIPTVLKEGEGFVIENGKIKILSDEFSVFALGYSDTLIPVTYTTTTVAAPVTGAYTNEDGSSSANASNSVAVALAAGTVTLALGGVAIFAKRK